MKVKIIIGLLFALTLSFGCKKESTLELTLPGPEASFDISYDAEGKVTFTNTSKNAVSFEWSFGDGNTSTSDLVTVSNTYENKGTYNVTLTAKNDEGESNSITKAVKTTTEPFVPKDYKSLKLVKLETFRNPGAYLILFLAYKGNSTSLMTSGLPSTYTGFNSYKSWSVTPPYEIKDLNRDFTFTMGEYASGQNRSYYIESFDIRFGDYKASHPTQITLVNPDKTIDLVLTVEWQE